MTRKFLIIGAARTGSTLLVKTLNTVEGMHCHGELLGPNKVRGFEDGVDLEHTSAEDRRAREEKLLEQRNADPLVFIQNALGSTFVNTEDGNQLRAAGFKMIYSTFNLPQWQMLINTLIDDPEISCIHLWRKNNLRRYISEQIANSGGPIHSGAGGRADVAAELDVDIEDFLANCVQVEAEFEAVYQRLPKERTLDVTYEELAADTNAAVTRVCDFLGLPITQNSFEAALTKVGAKDLRDTVSNYEQLLEHPATRELVLSD